MKRKAILIAALTLVIVLAFMGTLAYFTAQDTADNTITMGNVSIKIHEVDGNDEPWVDVTGVMPGTTVDKLVTVENTGSSPVWVRVQLTPSLTPAVTGWESLITVTTASTGWTLDGGYYYYDSILAPGATTSAVVSEVVFAQGMGNDYQGAVYNLNVAAEAVQSENNGTTALNASGW